MDKIICIVGESGCGKTTLCEGLEKEGYNIIKSYTTRKPRYEGEYGHTFADNYDTQQNNNIVAYTFFDGNHYWMERKQFEGRGTSIYVVDLAGVETLRKKVTVPIIVIYLDTDESRRWRRMTRRIIDNKIKDGVTPSFNDWDLARTESMSRVQHDNAAFKNVEYDYCVDANKEIRDVLKTVKAIIR